MLNVVSGIFKIAVVSMITGAALSALDLSAEQILAKVGLTPENVMELLERGAHWALPNIMLGSMVIVPIWLVVYLLRPPRG